jgi:hypothetical protein
MNARILVGLAVIVSAIIAVQALACCPAPPSGKPVVNADQTVVIVWNAATKTQHFIRKASFKSDADDFGFLIPSPSQPELEESGNEAFPYLLKLTEPEIKKMARPSGVSCGCGDSGATKSKDKDKAAFKPDVTVRAEKEVAGFHAVVLEAKTAAGLINWLKEHNYAYSPEVEAWAKPYVELGWMITALKVAKGADGTAKRVDASALRMSFKTDRPLFPYREPDMRSAADALKANHRLLRIYFLAEGRYQGELTKDEAWSGKVAWANPLAPAERKQTLELLKLPDQAVAEECWLTEFEDNWAYRPAPADVYFSHDPKQNALKRQPIIQYVSASWPTDFWVYAIPAALVGTVIVRRFRRERQGPNTK